MDILEELGRRLLDDAGMSAALLFLTVVVEALIIRWIFRKWLDSIALVQSNAVKYIEAANSVKTAIAAQTADMGLLSQQMSRMESEIRRDFSRREGA